VPRLVTMVTRARQPLDGFLDLDSKLSHLTLRKREDMDMKKLISGIGTLAIVFGVLALFAPTPAHAKNCFVRCSDATGCVICCVQKGGWVCS